jgi:acyl-CoA synthetase (NDP forming)
LASLSCSGGEASLIADAALAHPSIAFAGLQEHRKARLSAALGPRVTPANPLDYDTGIWRDEKALTDVMMIMTGDDISLTVLILDYPRGAVSEDWERVTRAVEQAAQTTGARFAVLSSLPENLPELIANRLIAAGIAPLAGFDDALKAIALSAQLSAVKRGAQDLRPDPIQLAQLPQNTCTLTEAEAKARLATTGLTVPQSLRADCPEAAGQAADRIGYPVVLKGEGVAHKTDAGAVQLGLVSREAVLAAAAAMPAERFLVETMIKGAVAELLVGIVLDPVHGYVLSIAAGGTLTELMEDRQDLLVPATETDIKAALSRLKLAAVLDGYRGQPGASRAAIVNAICCVQQYVVDHAGALVEVEINPLVCTMEEAIAVDALIVCDATLPDSP